VGCMYTQHGVLQLREVVSLLALEQLTEVLQRCTCECSVQACKREVGPQGGKRLQTSSRQGLLKCIAAPLLVPALWSPAVKGPAAFAGPGLAWAVSCSSVACEWHVTGMWVMQRSGVSDSSLKAGQSWAGGLGQEQGGCAEGGSAPLPGLYLVMQEGGICWPLLLQMAHGPSPSSVNQHTLSAAPAQLVVYGL
jgi:hypothetical protein